MYYFNVIICYIYWFSLRLFGCQKTDNIDIADKIRAGALTNIVFAFIYIPSLYFLKIARTNKLPLIIIVIGIALLIRLIVKNNFNNFIQKFIKIEKTTIKKLDYIVWASIFILFLFFFFSVQHIKASQFP